MVLDPGVATAAVAGCGVVIAAIVKFGPNKGNGNSGSYVSKELFEERTGSITQSLKRIENKLDAHVAHKMETLP